MNNDLSGGETNTSKREVFDPSFITEYLKKEWPCMGWNIKRKKREVSGASKWRWETEDDAITLDVSFYYNEFKEKRCLSGRLEHRPLQKEMYYFDLPEKELERGDQTKPIFDEDEMRGHLEEGMTRAMRKLHSLFKTISGNLEDMFKSKRQ